MFSDHTDGTDYFREPIACGEQIFVNSSIDAPPQHQEAEIVSKDLEHEIGARASFRNTECLS